MKDHLTDDGMVPIDRVAASAVVRVVLAFAEDVVDLVLKTFERERGAFLVAFAGVVEDDVEDDFDAGGMKCLDHLLELTHLRARRLVKRVTTVWRKERHRVIAPVVGTFERVAVNVQNRKLIDRHQLDRRHSQFFR